MKSSWNLFLTLLTIALIISFFLILSNVGIFHQKIPGSFEYVRKGEDLLNKSRFAEAVKYFERAYESSPENEVIKSDLVYAYSVYGKALVDKKKHDEAIDYLSKAFDIMPNTSTTQNLANIYSEKALYKAQRGDIANAEEAYAKARSLASGSDTVSRHLGIMLYNDGVSEYKSGREDIAILCLKESASVYKESQVFELLGDLHYKRARIEEAQYYWNEAKAINPDNEKLSEKLAKAQKEVSLAFREKESTLPHFEIRYRSDLSIDRDLASEILEKAYMDVGKDLGYFPKERTKIFFYSKEDFRNTFNMPYVVNAFYDGSIKMPAPETRLEKEKLSRYIYHEYAHALISAKTNNNCPVWLSEGIALWEEFRQDRSSIEGFFTKMKSLPDISINFLENNFKKSEIDKDRALCYMLSYALVDYILDNWGMEGLQGILGRLAKKQHIMNAIDDQLLLSEKEFEKRWRNHTLHKYFKIRDTS